MRRARPEGEPADAVSLRLVLREWGRIGCIGFGGPPAHIALLRELCVERDGWIGRHEFEDAIAACNLLPGPASTQLAIFCAWRVGGAAGRRPRRPRLHPARARPDPRARGAVPGRRRPRRGCAAPAPAPAPRSPPSPCSAGSGLVRRAGAGRRSRRGAGSPTPCAAAVAGRVIGPYARARADRAAASPRSLRRRAARGSPRARRPAPLLVAAGTGGGGLGARLDGVQGRRPLLRRRLRDHAADAGRRRRPLPLDDATRSS